MKLITGFALCLAAMAAQEAKLKITDLPAVVRKSVQEQLRGGELVGLSKEVEKGKTLYEVETKRNGKTRDMMIDSTGAVTEVEEEIDMGSVPAAAREAIQKKAAGAQVTKVEALSKGGAIVAYEAAVRKGRKTSEVAVTPDGKPFRD